MESLFIDFMDPLNRSKHCNIANLVLLDVFSKFVSFFPVRKISSQVVYKCRERAFFPAYGTPVSTVTDNAKVFRCKQIRGLCFRWGITHVTTPYYPQGSLAERVNRNLKSALKKLHHESQATWNEDLPWLSLAFNTAIHDSTKCTPDKVFLGREMKSSLLVRWDLTPISTNGTRGDNQSFWTQAYSNLKRARSKVGTRHDVDRKPHEYQVGDTVVYRMRLASSEANNISAKFLLRWLKSVVIAKIVRSNLCY